MQPYIHPHKHHLMKIRFSLSLSASLSLYLSLVLSLSVFFGMTLYPPTSPSSIFLSLSFPLSPFLLVSFSLSPLLLSLPFSVPSLYKFLPVSLLLKTSPPSLLLLLCSWCLFLAWLSPGGGKW